MGGLQRPYILWEKGGLDHCYGLFSWSGRCEEDAGEAILPLTDGGIASVVCVSGWVIGLRGSATWAWDAGYGVL